jgi:hypothetical protein
MNYQNVYNLLIEKAKTRTLENVYVEKHHIIPQSMGGTNDVANIIKLTAKEHFVAHHLLWKIHRNREMVHAFMLMCNIKRNGVKYSVSAKEYQLLKEDNKKFRSEFMTGRIGNNTGRVLSQEWKDNISKGQKGHGRGNGGSTGFKGKHWTEEQKKEISERMKGKKNHLGILHSEETKQMMRDNRKGKTKVGWTEERKAARRELIAKRNGQEKSPD